MTKICAVHLGPFGAEPICHIHLVQGHNPVYIHLAPEETKKNNTHQAVKILHVTILHL